MVNQESKETKWGLKNSRTLKRRGGTTDLMCVKRGLVRTGTRDKAVEVFLCAHP